MQSLTRSGAARRGLLVSLLGTSLIAVVLAACTAGPGPRPPSARAAQPALSPLTPAPNVAGDPAAGRRLFTDSRLFPPSGCGTCHTLPGVASGTLMAQAPNLNNVGLRPTLAGEALPNTPENMKRWIMDPASMKPGATMPKLPSLTDVEAQDLTAFLYSLPYNPSR